MSAECGFAEIVHSVKENQFYHYYVIKKIVESLL